MNNTPIIFGLLLLAAGCGSPSKDAEAKKSDIPSDADKDSPTNVKVGEKITPAVVLEPKTPPKAGFLMRLNPPVGKVQKYKLTNDLSLVYDKKGLPAGYKDKQRVLLTATFEVVPQKSDAGTIEFKMTSSPISVTQDGKASAFGATECLVNVDERCRVVTAFTDPISAMLGLGFVPFPENQVLPGASWRVEGSRDVPGFAQVKTGVPTKMQMTEVYKFMSGSKTQAWTIASKATAKNVPISSQGTYRFDPATGMLIGAEVVQNAEMDIPAGDNGKTVHAKARVFVKVERI